MAEVEASNNTLTMVHLKVNLNLEITIIRNISDREDTKMNRSYPNIYGNSRQEIPTMP